MPQATDIYRDATFTAETRAKLELAWNVLGRAQDNPDVLADPEIQISEARAAIREVCDRWDANDATEFLLGRRGF